LILKKYYKKRNTEIKELKKRNIQIKELIRVYKKLVFIKKIEKKKRKNNN